MLLKFGVLTLMVLSSKNIMKQVFLIKTRFTYSTGIGGHNSKNVDFQLIDSFEKVNDKDAAIYTRKLALDEGILLEILVEQHKGCQLKIILPKDVIVVLLRVQDRDTLERSITTNG